MGNRLDDFLNKTLREVIQVGAHEAIRDELTDHYYCLVEDYEEAGLDESEAEIKAVESLGDPKTIGKQLNNVWFPQLKWSIYWHVSTLIIITAFTFDIADTSSLFLNMIYFVVLAAVVFEISSQFPLYRYLLCLKKGTDISFLRIYNLKDKRTKNSVSYVERLTNRIVVIGGLFMAVYLVVMTYFIIVETKELSFVRILVDLNWLQIALRFNLSMKLSNNPVVIADDKGLWIQGRTTPYIRWDKIKSIGSRRNYNKDFMCEIKRQDGRLPIEFPCIPEDIEILRMMHSESLAEGVQEKK